MGVSVTHLYSLGNNLPSWMSTFFPPINQPAGIWGTAPRVPGYPIIGVLPLFYQKGIYAAMNEFHNVSQDYGLSFSNVITTPIVYLRDPLLIREILVLNANKITRHGIDGKGPFCTLHRIYGMVPAVAEGSEWLRWRSSLMSEFYKVPSLRQTYPEILRISQQHVQKLREVVSGPDLFKIMQFWALDTVWFMAMGVDNISHDADDALHAMAKFNPLVGDFRHILIHAIRNFCLGKSFVEPDVEEKYIGHLLSNALNTFFEKYRDNIDPETVQPGRNSNFLKRVSQKSGGTSKEPVTEDFLALAKQILAFGHETPAQFCFWSIFEFDRSPEIVQKLRAELSGHGCSPSTLDFDKIRSLPYLDMVYKELLRIHPPIHATARRIIDPVTLRPRCGEEIVLPAGTMVFASMYALHHDEQVWGSDADKFRPDRWEGVSCKSLESKCEFLPFLTGPRSCPASNYVETVVKTMLALLVMQVDIKIVQPARKGFESTSAPIAAVAYEIHEFSF
jgi:cytochrome P450